jgi:hypothetical protein
MPTQTPFVTLDEVRSRLPFSDTNFDKDKRLQGIIATSSMQIEAALGRVFASQAYVEFFNSRNTRRFTYDVHGDSDDGFQFISDEIPLYLQGWNVDEGEIFEVRYDTSRTFGAGSVVPASNYDLDQANSRLFLAHPMFRARRSIQVTYTAGYANDGGSPATLSGTLPDDLKEACILQSIHMFTRTDVDNIGLAIDRTKGRAALARFTTMSGITPEAASLIKKYRRLSKGMG